MPFLGGLRILSIVYPSPLAVQVTFATTYTDKLYQLYAGRKRIGATGDLAERAIVAQLQSSFYPQHIAIVAVDPADRLLDLGDELPKRPYNRVRIRFTTDSSPSDMEFLDVTGADEPGGEVNPDNLIERVPFDIDRQYEILTPPLSGSGVWPFKVAGRDNKPVGGNAGPALDLEATVLAYPPDVAMTSADGPRFSVAIDAGVATATFTPQF
mgnify:CR=1 FL=1